MRKMLFAPLAISMVALLSVLYLPAVSAETLRSDQLIVWELRTDPDPDPRLVGSPPDYVDPDTGTAYWGYWMGPVDFGGEMTGTAYFATDPTGAPTVPGATFHFYEWFYIAFDDGGWVLGHDDGVYLYLSPSANWVYMATGWVTDASPDYAGLIGYHFFERGMTTDPFAEETVGIGFCFLGPMHGGSGGDLHLR